MIKGKTNKTFVSRLLDKVAVIFLCLLLFAGKVANAQVTTEYQVKAVFLYNFTRFIDWPPKAFESATSPFVIGILGADPFGTHLDETVLGEFTGQHPIVVKRFENVKDLDNCHILFISSAEAEQFKNLSADFKDKTILTVSDINNFADLGGIIGFFLEKNKIRMEINTAAAKAASLVISSKLLSVAKVL